MMILPVLALIDSTSIGTLVIPMWLLLRRERIAKVFGYLAVIAAFYWGVGLLLNTGLASFSALLESRWVKRAGLVIGALMIGGAILYPTKSRASSPRVRGLRTGTGLFTLAVLAGVMELPTMLPYVAAIGIMQQYHLSGVGQALVLAGYCLVMIVPAALLCLLKRRYAAGIDRWLAKASEKLARFAAESTAWVVGIAGYLLIRVSLPEAGFNELFF